MIRRALARALEREKPGWMRALGVSLDPVRALQLPPGVVIGVGGATLGGSGRTPLALAVARALGPDVAFVAHGYGGSVRAARRVDREDSASVVGDEALLAARALDCPVFVGPRAEALALAARAAPVVVVDRLLQTSPRRLSCSLLAVNASAPWGAGARLPFGDLLAPPTRLAGCADEVVVVGGALAPEAFALAKEVRGLRVGAIASMARPDRMRRALASLGVVPAVFVERPDHAPFRAAELTTLDRRGRGLDAWIVDPKTAILLPRSRTLGPIASAETIELSHTVTLSRELLRRIRAHAKLANGGARC